MEDDIPMMSLGSMSPLTDLSSIVLCYFRAPSLAKGYIRLGSLSKRDTGKNS